jgi:hypothetical protein
MVGNFPPRGNENAQLRAASIKVLPASCRQIKLNKLNLALWARRPQHFETADQTVQINRRSVTTGSGTYTTFTDSLSKVLPADQIESLRC